jgi:5'-methylthioadenosine phosphorylase
MRTLTAFLTDSLPAGAVGEAFPTPYGLSDPIAVLDSGLAVAPITADPRATIQALKDRGAAHLWLCESVGSLSSLLEPGDWLVPDDYIDGTRGLHYTFFSEKAGGYLQQVPAFDPESRAALIHALAAETPRPFRRGIYACVSSTRLETPAEALFWSRAGAHVVGRWLSPYLTLARERDLRVAVLVHIVRAGGETGAPLPFDRFLPVVRSAAAALQSFPEVS